MTYNNKQQIMTNDKRQTTNKTIFWMHIMKADHLNTWTTWTTLTNWTTLTILTGQWLIKKLIAEFALFTVNLRKKTDNIFHPGLDVFVTLIFSLLLPDFCHTLTSLHLAERRSPNLKEMFEKGSSGTCHFSPFPNVDTFWGIVLILSAHLFPFRKITVDSPQPHIDWYIHGQR